LQLFFYSLSFVPENGYHYGRKATFPNFQPQQIAATTKEVKQAGFNREEHTMPYIEWFDAPT
jgi:hypothetical protein